jgi:hypothetical protein
MTAARVILDRGGHGGTHVAICRDCGARWLGLTTSAALALAWAHVGAAHSGTASGSALRGLAATRRKAHGGRR